MKKVIVFPALAICLLCLACHQVPTIENANSEKYDVYFRLHLDASIIPFPDSKSIPDTFPSEPSIGEDPSEPGKKEPPAFDYVYYAIFNMETQQLFDEGQLAKNQGIDDFGEYLYLSLSPGSYQMTVVTHSSAETSANDKLFQLDDLTDTFLGKSSFTVERDKKPDEMTVSLTRRVSRVEFVPTDDIPDEVKEFQIAVQERYVTINLFTGVCAPNKSNYVYKYRFSEEEKRNIQPVIHAFYTFVPEEENIKLPEVKLLVKAEDDLLLWQKTVSNVPIYRNKITQYTGKIYSSGMVDGTFDLDFPEGGEWGGVVPQPLP